jgi:hypothetical protein
MDPKLDLRLRELRNQIPQVDPLLQRLVRQSAYEPARILIGVSLLLGDVQVRGVPAADDVMGKEIDGGVAWFFRIMAAIKDEAGEPSETFKELAREIATDGLFASSAMKDDEARQEFMKEMDEGGLWPADLMTLPEDLANKAIRFLPPLDAITLEQASVKIPGEDEWENVGTMRVSLSHVSAWWPVRVEPPEHVAGLLEEEDNSAST